MPLGGWAACGSRPSARTACRLIWWAVGIKVSDRETRDLPDIYAALTKVNKLVLYTFAQAPDY